MPSSSSLTALLHSTASLYCGRFPVYPVRLSCGNLRSFSDRLSVRAISCLSLVETIRPVLMGAFNYTNIHQVPKVDKVVVNCGIGEAVQNAKGLNAAMNDLAIITGQKPVKTRVKIREGQPPGISVTLRGNVMHSFLDRLINLGLPMAWDFQGVNVNSFDGHGNCRLGLPNESVFPELTSNVLFKARGMYVCIATTANSDAEAHKLLALMGMPFKEGGGGGAGAGAGAGAASKKMLKSHHLDSKSKQRARK